jgi:uncharacterized protein YkwD
MSKKVSTQFDQAPRLAIAPQRQTFRTSIESGNQFFEIRLKNRSHLKLRLGNLRSNVDLELIRDRNGNGKIDSDEIVASSRATGSKGDHINVVGLEKGNYVVRVSHIEGGKTSYKLMRAATSVRKPNFAYDIVQQTNAFRAQNDLPALAVNTQLTKAAQKYARVMAVQDNFSHTGPDGSSPWERIRKADYDFSDAAENLAAGHTTPTSAMTGWKNSSGHRANLLAYQVKEIGVGYYYYPKDDGRYTYQHYWSQSMGTLKGEGAFTVPDKSPTRYPDR